MSHKNLILFTNNTIHSLNMLLGHRRIWAWLQMNLENANDPQEKFLIGAEIVYIDAIEMLLMNDVVLKIHGLLEERGSEDYILNEKFKLLQNKIVISAVDGLNGVFCLTTLYHIRNRYVGHLDIDHNKRNKNSIKEPENPNNLDQKFSEMITIRNLEKAIAFFSEIFNELDGDKKNSIDEIKKGSDEFWERYRLGIGEKTGLK